MIFVAGATGNVGGELVRLLAARGTPVRALSRRAPAEPWPDGVEPVIGDLSDPGSFAAALEGVEGVFLLSGYDHLDRLLEYLREQRVARVVLLSANSSVNGDLDNVVSRYHVLSERAVQQSGLSWTVLRPVSFAANTLQWVPQLREGDTVTEPFADVPVAVVDPLDIAAVAAQALVTGDHAAATYRLTGPQALLPSDRARVLAGVLGRPIRFVAQGDDDARVNLAERMEPRYVDAMFDFFRSGDYDEATVSPAVADVTGRPSRTFEQWAVQHAGAFGD